jgi:hypothetical protein
MHRPALDDHELKHAAPWVIHPGLTHTWIWELSALQVCAADIALCTPTRASGWMTWAEGQHGQQGALAAETLA